MTDAAPAPAPAPAGEAASPVQSASAEIMRLRSGADQAFSAAFANDRDPGHRAAVDKMAELHKAAYPEPGDGAAAAEDAGDTPAAGPLPFAFPEDMTAPEMAERTTAANEAIASMGIAPKLARGAVATIEKAIAARSAVPMGEAELQQFDSMLKSRWGDSYDAQVDKVAAAFDKAGTSRDWLRRSILASGPQTALWIFETLATSRQA
jgi:hypothetical protein